MILEKQKIILTKNKCFLQVFKVFDQGLKLIIKVIPRLNFVKFSNSNLNKFKNKFNQYDIKPPKKLFNIQEIRKLNQQVEKFYNNQIGKTVHRFQGRNYYNGFLLLNINLNKIVILFFCCNIKIKNFRCKLYFMFYK